MLLIGKHLTSKYYALLHFAPCHSSSADLATGRNGSTERTVEGSNEETTHAATTSAPPTRLRWSRLSPSSRRPKRLAHKGSVATITDASDLSVLRRAGTRRPLMAGPTLVAASHSLPLGPDGTARRPISPAKSSAPAGQGRGYRVTVGVALCYKVRWRSQHAVRLRHLREARRLTHSHEGGGGQAGPQQAYGK